MTDFANRPPPPLPASPTRMAHRVVIDCDTGIDDTLAIFYAALTAGVELVALTSVWGNVPVELATRNNLALVELLGLDIPVARGAAGPINGGPALFGQAVHGEDGQGNRGIPTPSRREVPQHGAELIVELARSFPGELDLVAVGPLTNVALALGLEPRLPSLLRTVTVMGGAANAPGNRTPVAEANIWHDPEAAAAVAAASWDLTLVPLDVTMTVLLTEEHRQRLATAGTPASRRAADITDLYFDYFAQRSYGQRCSPMHDVLAVAFAIGDLVPRLAPRVALDVDTSYGPSRGSTICDTRGRYRDFAGEPSGAVRVLLDVDPDFAETVVQRLMHWPPPARPVRTEPVTASQGEP
jgi:purine nucleosidase